MGTLSASSRIGAMGGCGWIRVRVVQLPFNKTTFCLGALVSAAKPGYLVLEERKHLDVIHTIVECETLTHILSESFIHTLLYI